MAGNARGCLRGRRSTRGKNGAHLSNQRVVTIIVLILLAVALAITSPDETEGRPAPKDKNNSLQIGDMGERGKRIKSGGSDEWVLLHSNRATQFCHACRT